MADRQIGRTGNGRLRRSAPLLMLLLVTTGVFGMHTLGHAGSGHVAGHPPVSMPVGVAHAMDDGCCGAPAARALGGHAPGVPMSDPTAICLAILCAALLAVVVFPLRRNRQSGERRRDVAAAVSRTGRGPPGRPRLGLLIADLAVLRN
jgi:hypothetical protein